MTPQAATMTSQILVTTRNGKLPMASSLPVPPYRDLGHPARQLY
jgi:hypothetical protein